MQTGVPNPIPIVSPVRLPGGKEDWVRVLKDLTDYVNAFNTALQTVVPIRTVGVSYTLGLTDRVVVVDATAGNVVITIPPPGVYPSGLPIWGDFVFTVKRIDASVNTVTVVAADGALIDGVSSLAMAQWDAFTLRPYAAYGSNVFSAWAVVS